MNSRGGRLIADIMMSISKGYIDNLREEVKKGLYGRLKQGIYPFLAPRGYTDTGGGNVKEIDPKIAPLIKEAFSLYAEGKYSLTDVAKKMAKKGLLSSQGNPIGKNVLSIILQNPFYIGLMKVKGETYVGQHQSIVSSKTFQQVQKILSGKVVKKTRHNYRYRTALKCPCGRVLVGEKQKQ